MHSSLVHKRLADNSAILHRAGGASLYILANAAGVNANYSPWHPPGFRYNNKMNPDPAACLVILLLLLRRLLLLLLLLLLIQDLRAADQPKRESVIRIIHFVGRMPCIQTSR